MLMTSGHRSPDSSRLARARAGPRARGPPRALRGLSPRARGPSRACGPARARGFSGQHFIVYIFLHSVWHLCLAIFFRYLFWQSNTYFQIYSGINWHSRTRAFYLAYLLACYLAYVSIWHNFWQFKAAMLWHLFWNSFWHTWLLCLLTFSVAFYLTQALVIQVRRAPLWSGFCGWGQARRGGQEGGEEWLT